MAKNITLMGANYSDVPSVVLPKTGGGTAEFTDTSDADATASDIASGKTAYVNGVKIVGEGSGGGFELPEWLEEGQTVTVGANSITNTQQASDYFSTYTPYWYILLKTVPTVNNQVVELRIDGASGARYRNDSISSTAISTVYDGKLIEGTEYVILKLK